MTARPGSPEEALDVWRSARAATGRRPSAVQLAEQSEALATGEVVVWDDGAVQAYAHGRIEGEDLRLEAVVVVPTARGRGLAAAVADALADRAYAHGARRVVAPRGEADAFWRALGLHYGGDPAAPWTGVLDPPQRDLPLSADGLRLGQLLKLAGLVDTGAEAKALLVTGEVLLNGEAEVRRGRQVGVGDVVTALGQAVRIVPPEG